MQVSVETTSGLERKLTVSVEAKNVDDAALVKMKELARTQRMNGFRPGKIPLNVIKKRFGEHVRQDVISEVMQRSFYEAVVQEKLQPAGAPKIEPLSMKEGSDLEFVATFDVYPEIELQDFSKISIEKDVAEVADDDLDNMLDTLKEQQAKWVEVKRKAKSTDQLLIDFVGTIEDEEFQGGKADNFELIIGKAQMIPGFEEQLTGAKAGDEVEIKVTFPEDYQNKDVAGKQAVFKTNVQKVSKKEALELAELAEKLGIEDGDIDIMKADIRKNMERELSQLVNSKLKQQIMDALVEAHDVDLPKDLVKQEIEQQKRQALQQFGGADGANLPELPDELFSDKASQRVKLGLVVSEIIKQNKITSDKDKVRAKLDELASVYEQPEDVVNYYLSDENRLADVEQMVLEDTVIELVQASAKVKEVKKSFDELMNPDKETDKVKSEKTNDDNKPTKKKAVKKKATATQTSKETSDVAPRKDSTEQNKD
ncbi:MAG: trigger factor [Kangiellaceae bacterium]|nr:trigger factor [Kangiellaceae bacterium]